MIENPKSYHHKRITVKGVAQVQGSSFVLYRSFEGASGLTPASEAVVVVRRSADATNYDRLNRKWVTVTGTVDAKGQGHWNYACTILLEGIELADHTTKRSARRR